MWKIIMSTLNTGLKLLIGNPYIVSSYDIHRAYRTLEQGLPHFRGTLYTMCHPMISALCFNDSEGCTTCTDNICIVR